MCLESDLINPATVVDHIVPHRLHFAQTAEKVKTAQKRFWDEKNWQPLCVQHHNTTKQRMEKGNKGFGCDENGMPSNPNIVTGINKINREGGLKVPVKRAY
ncbi:HNH endonuclease [Sodalis glossinidius]|uniref:HNH endonuclease n=1 Tax=Sodalis glossinidius TaxID=63612 RepID=UPI00311DB1B1